MKRSRWYAYVIAVMTGLVAEFLHTALVAQTLRMLFVGPAPSLGSIVLAVVIAAMIYGVSGLLMGWAWPSGTWKWGLWIAAPALFISGLGVLFLGLKGFGFLLQDVPLIATGFAAACLGGLFGARVSTRGHDVDKVSLTESETKANSSGAHPLAAERSHLSVFLPIIGVTLLTPPVFLLFRWIAVSNRVTTTHADRVAEFLSMLPGVLRDTGLLTWIQIIFCLGAFVTGFVGSTVLRGWLRYLCIAVILVAGLMTVLLLFSLM